jgi:rubredoxin
MPTTMLRGHRPWSDDRTVESDDGRVPIVPRRVTYRCPRNHDLIVPFADLADSEIPTTWECPRHSAAADRVEAGGANPEKKKGHQPKTAWQQLIERRTIPELEALLEQRLQALRAERRTAPIRAATTRSTTAKQ